MKKIPVFIVILFNLISPTITAQDWDLFPANQRSYYRMPFNYGNFGIGTIDMLVNDSSGLSGTVKTLYFERLSYSPGWNNCYSALHNFNTPNDPYYFDELKVDNDTTIFNYNSNTRFYFLPKSSVGQTWTINGFTNITVHCDSLNAGNVLGIPDSIKTFSLHSTAPGFDTIPIRLSKTFGLLDFIPFQTFTNNWSGFDLYHLIGIKDSSIAVGFQQPQFYDFLPYHAGDVLFWDSLVQFYPTVNKHIYLRDSITQVNTYADSLIYIFNRKQLDPNGVVTLFSGQTRSFTRENLGNVLESPSNTISFSRQFTYYPNEYSIWNNEMIKVIYDTVVGTESIQYDLAFYSWYVDTFSCSIHDIIDGEAYYFSFDTHLGLIEMHMNHQTADFYLTLKSANINGIQYGNPNYDLEVANITDKNPIKIFPNPASKYIYISLEKNKLYNFSVYSYTGQLQINKTFYSGNTIDISTLKDGIFYFVIDDKNLQYKGKFLKISE